MSERRQHGHLSLPPNSRWESCWLRPHGSKTWLHHRASGDGWNRRCGSTCHGRAYSGGPHSWRESRWKSLVMVSLKNSCFTKTIKKPHSDISATFCFHRLFKNEIPAWPIFSQSTVSTLLAAKDLETTREQLQSIWRWSTFSSGSTQTWRCGLMAQR